MTGLKRWVWCASPFLTTYAHYRLLPKLPEFVAAFPQVTLELQLSNHSVDFVHEKFDLAIRLGHLKDSRLVSRKLEEASLGVFASPEYLRRFGAPTTVDELRKHRLIQFIRPNSGRGMPWIFRQRGKDVDFEFDSTVRIEDDVLGCLSYARAGGGLFQIYHFIANPYVVSGELVEVFLGEQVRSRPFSVVYPLNRYQPTRVRALIRFLTSRT